MKRLKQCIIFTFICLTMLLCKCTAQSTNTMGSLDINNIEDCLTIENFDLVKKFILKNGIKTKLYTTGIIADTNTLSSQIFFGNKTLALIDYQDYNHIIIIDKLNEDEIPIYFVSNENNSCQISAYYSVFDTEKSISIRNENWCKITIGIKNWSLFPKN